VEAGQILLKAFSEIITGEYEIVSTTQSSIAKSRPASLAQESDCPSAVDMLIVNFKAAAISNETIASTILPATMAYLRSSITNCSVTIHGFRQHLPGSRHIHAEQGCTQHVYHYLLPVSWLPDPHLILPSLLDRSIPTPPALIRLKQVLRSAEGLRVDAAVNARFGALKYREHRPYHNFADPTLRGEASPNNQVVWRVLDRARIIGWVPTNDVDAAEDKEDTLLIIEFSGDEFLKQQVRRILGAAVAMTQEWLPTGFMNQALDRQVVVETPLAPAGYMYRAGSRYHAIEIFNRGKQLLEWESVHRLTKDPLDWMQCRLVERRMTAKDSTAWLHRLHDEVTPRICAQLQGTTLKPELSASLGTLTTAPVAYQRVLRLLQQMVETNQWPVTSAARASVILGDLDVEDRQAGSFTVISDAVVGLRDYEVPRGNSLFPDLTKAVFDLEQSLASEDSAGDTRGRPPSSHCAINCNAQFTPHVDSGRGSGQSLSMIVALGDFVGGELMVEGHAHDIRYRPLEFDGWKMRHWTQPFSGQRFSLVWFTPEGMSMQPR
jgi:tRNA U38,U39,U40 pseudouridine synthase TruA